MTGRELHGKFLTQNLRGLFTSFRGPEPGSPIRKLARLTVLPSDIYNYRVTYFHHFFSSHHCLLISPPYTHPNMAPDAAERGVHPVHADYESETNSIKASSVFRKALRLGRVEEKGIQPIPVEERTVTRFYNIFTVWASINSNILG